MHERKVQMAKRVGGFIGLPGGYGTFEEVTTLPHLDFFKPSVELLVSNRLWK